MSNIRERVLNSCDLSRETVHVPAWGVDVAVRGMNARERIAFTETAHTQRQMPKAIARVVIACTYDPETNDRVFLPTDEDALLDRSGAAVESIFLAVVRMSGMGEDAIAAAKNGLGASADSSSVSPAT